jgi:hypothetical protein
MKHDTIAIKLGCEDPTEELLEELMQTINDYLSVYAKLAEPRIEGKYLYIKYFYCDDNWRMDGVYVSGMIAGYLMANRIEVI